MLVFDEALGNPDWYWGAQWVAYDCNNNYEIFQGALPTGAWVPTDNDGDGYPDGCNIGSDTYMGVYLKIGVPTLAEGETLPIDFGPGNHTVTNISTLSAGDIYVEDENNTFWPRETSDVCPRPSSWNTSCAEYD